MDMSFLSSMIGTAFGAALGGFAAWVAIKVDVALAREKAEQALSMAKDISGRFNAHIEAHHMHHRKDD